MAPPPILNFSFTQTRIMSISYFCYFFTGSLLSKVYKKNNAEQKKDRGMKNSFFFLPCGNTASKNKLNKTFSYLLLRLGVDCRWIIHVIICTQCVSIKCQVNLKQTFEKKCCFKNKNLSAFVATKCFLEALRFYVMEEGYSSMMLTEEAEGNKTRMTFLLRRTYGTCSSLILFLLSLFHRLLIDAATITQIFKESPDYSFESRLSSVE